MNDNSEINLLERKERQFHLVQTIERAILHINQDRATLLDHLVIQLTPSSSYDPEIPIKPLLPSKLLSLDNSISLEKLYELKSGLEDVKSLLSLDIDMMQTLFIDNLLYIVEYQLNKRIGKSLQIPESIISEIECEISDKSISELESLSEYAIKKLQQQVVDNDYWQGLLNGIQVAIAFKKADLFCKDKKRQYAEPIHITKPESIAIVSIVNWDDSELSVKLWEYESNRKLSNEEENFDTEVNISLDKSLIKPRYNHRVLTGFEWNKYNQTHYDHENPPPKSVFGYRFNMIYTQLPQGKIPSYIVLPDPENQDFEVIKFIAGNPYQDVAFRIIKQEWEYSHKHGFKCFFDSGVLRLHFRFKKQFYKR